MEFMMNELSTQRHTTEKRSPQPRRYRRRSSRMRASIPRSASARGRPSERRDERGRLSRRETRDDSHLADSTSLSRFARFDSGQVDRSIRTARLHAAQEDQARKAQDGARRVGSLAKRYRLPSCACPAHD